MAERARAAENGAVPAQRSGLDGKLDGPDLAFGADTRQAGSLLESRSMRLLKLSAATIGCLALANCATSGDKMGRVKDPKYGVYASPRVVAGTEAIDPAVSRRGVYMVGRPYQVAGKRYVPHEDVGYKKVGMASWYGDDFHGRLTANGEVFDMHDITAAHATMPLPSYARVTNEANATPSSCASMIAGRSMAAASSTCRAAPPSCWPSASRVSARSRSSISVAPRSPRPMRRCSSPRTPPCSLLAYR